MIDPCQLASGAFAWVQGCELDHGEEAGRELVVASRDVAEVLRLGEEALDQVVDPKLAPKTWTTLDRINQVVNGYIVPASNLDHWGITGTIRSTARAIARSTRCSSANCFSMPDFRGRPC